MASPDDVLHRKAARMAAEELRKRYRAEYWALCTQFFDQLKAELAAGDG